MYKLKESLAKNYINFRGWNTRRKLLLIESDDWGAIRMPSLDAYNSLINANIPVDSFYFDQYDSLESEEDLQLLFETLQEFKDYTGHHPELTAYFVTSNPNFEKIIASGLTEYYHELFTETYKRQSHTLRSFNKVMNGIEKQIFFPQYHGREHIQVRRWMEAINSDSLKEKTAFKERAIISSDIQDSPVKYPLNYFAAFDFNKDHEQNEIADIVAEGLVNFERIFGFSSISFTAQGSIYGDRLNSTLSENGVRLIGGQQLHPTGDGKLKKINHFWGRKNDLNQYYWRRNCRFEPTRNQNYDWVSQCFNEINVAFRWGKPAVISSHRVNYIGSIFPENRSKSLKKIHELLSAVVKKWPDVEFINTNKLAEIMLTSLENKDQNV